jgi:hypothetical protein
VLRQITPWIATLAALSLAAGCQLLDPRLSCTADSDCGIGVCNAGFCDDPLPPIDDDIPDDVEDIDPEDPAPETTSLVCDGDSADFAWHPVGELQGGVSARLVEHEGEPLLVGGQGVHRLVFGAAGPVLEPVAELAARHDAAGLASDGEQLVIAGGEDMRGEGTVLEILEGARVVTALTPGLTEFPLDQAAFLPDGNLVVAHGGSGHSACVDLTGNGGVATMSNVTGRQLVQVTGGVLAVGRGAGGEQLVLFTDGCDADWTDFATLPADDGRAWTDFAVAHFETPSEESVFLAGGRVDGELSRRVVRINPRATPPTVQVLPNMRVARRDPAAVVLDDGALMVIGGFAGPGDPNNAPYDAPVELFRSGAWADVDDREVQGDGLPGDVIDSTALNVGGCVAVVDAVGAPALWIFAREATEL